MHVTSLLAKVCYNHEKNHIVRIRIHILFKKIEIIIVRYSCFQAISHLACIIRLTSCDVINYLYSRSWVRNYIVRWNVFGDQV